MPLGDTKQHWQKKKKENLCVFIIIPINIFFEYECPWWHGDSLTCSFCVFAVCVAAFDHSTRVSPVLAQLSSPSDTLIHDPPDTAVPTVILRHVWVPCWIAPFLQCCGPVTLSDKRPGVLFAPASLPRCQISWAKPMEITITDLHGLYSLTVCWYALTQTSFMSIHKYVTENNCWQSLLVMFTLHDDKTSCDSRGGKSKSECGNQRRFWWAVLVGHVKRKLLLE